jgi:hypothetical protein
MIVPRSRLGIAVGAACLLSDISCGPGYQTLADLLSWCLVPELFSIEALREVQGDELLTESSVSLHSFTGNPSQDRGTELLLVPRPGARSRRLPSVSTCHVARGTGIRFSLPFTGNPSHGRGIELLLIPKS